MTTTASSIITPMASPMISTNNIMATTPTAMTPPTRTNEHELANTTGSSATNSSSANNNNNFINPFKTINTTANYTSGHSILNSNDTYSDDSEMLQTIEYIGTVLSFYYIPIIVGTGSIGNILSVFVFFKTKLRKLSSSFYLAALAVSDTCFLLGLFAQWLNFVEVHIYNREYFCQFFTFFSNLACFCSVWFVVAFTVERFIAVMYPLRRQTMCTVRRAKMVLVGLTILGCLHCAPFWISSTPVYSPKLGTTICDIKSEYKDYITLLNYWDTIVVFAVPFTTIAILNTFTGCTVWKFATVRRTLTMQKMKTQHLPLHGTMSSPSSSCSAREGGGGSVTAAPAPASANAAATMAQQQGISTYRLATSSLKRQKTTSCGNSLHSNGEQHNHNHTHHPHHQQQQQQSHQPEHQHQHHTHHTHPNRATMIKHAASGSSDIFSRKSRRRKVTNSSQLKVTKMLLIVSTVFVCLNLPSFIMRMITYLETQSSTNEKTTVVLQYIFQLLFITNFGINFVLYCVSGQNFRKAVLSLFRKVSTTQRDGTTQITVSEYYRNTSGIIGSCGTSTSTRRRMMTQNVCNEIHELQRLK
ncbi:alpha-2C adrenergic receptor-like [Calliphora vicina]|uniref:alpha-2C adrenergic receptor-like n=1 Tax=Calliphora vicina TaxID=7373 RepID=UPI00325A50F6